jgi:NAD(P)H dehydrogenase (quinone)
MRILAVFAHPSAKCFNRSVLDTLLDVAKAKAHETSVLDLYAEKFDPVLSEKDFEMFNRGKTPPDIQAMQQQVADANVVAFIHPLWWFGMPAILKGWIDRVFSYGFAYGHDSHGVKPLLAGKKAIVINTAGGSEGESYTTTGFRDAIIKLNDQGIYRFVGFDILLRTIFFEIPAASDEQRRELLSQLRDDLVRAL